MSSNINDGILNLYIDNNINSNNSIGIKLSGKGFINNSNISYDRNGIGLQLYNNSSNIKELSIIDTSNINNSNYPTLRYSITNNNTSIKSITSNNIYKPLIINDYITITSNSLGIGTSNPTTSLDVRGNMNLVGSLNLNGNEFSTINNISLPISSATSNIISGSSSYYYLFTSSNAITFTNTTFAELLLVGAGGNGGFGNFSGGGGAGEVIYISNYIFNPGLYLFNVGISTNNPFNRISKIIYNNNEIISAFGGGDGGGIINYSISGSGNSSPLTFISGTNDAFISFTSGTTIITFNNSILCDILIVGGGGSGGIRTAGGGGGGAVIYLENQILSSGVYTINIGKGGDAVPSNTTFSGANGNNGDDTFVVYNSSNLYLAKGGGGGAGSSNNNINGKAGGSSGGGTWNTSSDNVLTTNIPSGEYGYKGGSGNRTDTLVFSGGGGGGAGGQGTSASGTTAGDGGPGRQISITGTNIFYGAGGGGGSGQSLTTSGSAGSGGTGGGGAGSYGYTKATSGTTNTGSGGGGSGFEGDNNGESGAGGSGIVIIRIKNIKKNPTSGGSGGGGYINELGAIAGNKNNINSLITSGNNGLSTIGGNGGSALLTGGYTINMIGSNIIVGTGGIGVGNSGGGINGINYGDGGSGNGGLGRQGVIIIKYPINSNKNIEFTTDFVETNNIILNNNTNIYIGSNLNIFDNFWNKSQLNENNIIYTQGNIGIGTIRPLYTLDILGDVNISGNYKRNGTNLSISGTTFSDERIKNNIIDIDNNEALNKILKITPKKFNYINNEENDNYINYGFIAQEIKEIIPEAIRIQKDFIPNIYNNYKCSNNEIFIEEKLNNEIKKDDIIKIKIENNNYIETKILDISSNIIKIDKEINENNCFIYGKKVDDFHLLDKDYIYTLGISATQELYNRIKKIENKYEEQQDKIKKIINVLKY